MNAVLYSLTSTSWLEGVRTAVFALPGVRGCRAGLSSGPVARVSWTVRADGDDCNTLRLGVRATLRAGFAVRPCWEDW